VAVAAAAACAAALIIGPAAAQTAAKDLKAVTRVSTLTLEAAQAAAQAALEDCRKRGATVAVAVVDRSGVPLVLLRDGLAGMHTPDTAQRKAWTAASFRSGTVELARATAYDSASSGIRNLPGVAMIGGGLPMQSAGSLVGAIGVSGAPGGDMDEACAKTGIDAVAESLELN